MQTRLTIALGHLAAVPVRMLAVPIPRCFHDRLDVEITGLPVQRRLGQGAVGDQLGGIARPPGADLLGYRVPRHSPTCLNHFPNTMPSAGPQIQTHPFARLQLLEGQHVSFAEIIHVNVVANAGAVGSRIVVPEDRDLVALP